MKPALSLRLSQHLALTPQLQQSIRLLQLSTVELNQELEQALADNPLLERDDDPLAMRGAASRRMAPSRETRRRREHGTPSAARRPRRPRPEKRTPDGAATSPSTGAAGAKHAARTTTARANGRGPRPP